jgi:stage II sporulation protein D
VNFFFPLYTPKIKFNNYIVSLLFSIIFLSACASTKRFYNSNDLNLKPESNFIRVLIKDQPNSLIINVNSQILLYNSDKLLAKVKSGNKLFINTDENKLKILIADKEFIGDTFFVKSGDEDSIIKVDDKKFRGSLKIFLSDSQIKLLNQIGLEDYVKGVMTKEMPIGKGNENYEALKAFSVCARTYAINKIFEGKLLFDIYPDTRDQLYGGVDAENEKTNQIVDETRGLILYYDNSPAIIFYSACCGGYTEDVKNVFGKTSLSYLISLKDGDGPYCSIAPKFNWIEEYSEELFLSRLYDAKLIPSENFRIKDISVESRFNSGRVNELDIIVQDSNKNDKTISLFGNNIRNIIRTADGKSILRSTLFDISFTNNKVLISGKGFGHGVGFCQWGAIGQSRNGVDYSSILNHYFPGTKVINLHD